jgi:tetratricopeptide (TPR) repeat protein
MKHLFILLSLTILLGSCGESEDKKTESTENNNENNTTKETKDPALESEDLTILQELDDQLVKNDLTIDINVAKELYTRSIDFSKDYPESENLEIVLSYAAKGAEGIENFKEAVEILHKLSYDIPESNKTVIYMYNKGKILEEKIKDKEAAKAAYKELIKRFPRNPISKNMKSYLSNGLIDMSKEDKIKYLQEQNQD